MIDCIPPLLVRSRINITGAVCTLAFLALLLVGCAVGASPTSVSPTAVATATVHVISNGWHTGLVLAREDIPAAVLPEIDDFPAANYLEFGWGDRAYYPHPDPGVGLALSALLQPTPSVMHIAGHEQAPRAAGRALTVLVIPLTAAQLRELVAAIDASFDRPADGRATAVAAGLYADSLFYPAVGQFHLYQTCNTWTAQRFAAAGFAMPAGVIRARTVMRALEPLAVAPDP